MPAIALGNFKCSHFRKEKGQLISDGELETMGSIAAQLESQGLLKFIEQEESQSPEVPEIPELPDQAPDEIPPVKKKKKNAKK